MQSESTTPRLLRVPEAARALGMSSRWMWDRVLAREIPVVCLGRRRMIRLEDLEDFIADRTERPKGKAGARELGLPADVIFGDVPTESASPEFSGLKGSRNNRREQSSA